MALFWLLKGLQHFFVSFNRSKLSTWNKGTYVAFPVWVDVESQHTENRFLLMPHSSRRGRRPSTWWGPPELLICGSPKENISFKIWRWNHDCTLFIGVINTSSKIFPQLAIKMKSKLFALQKCLLVFANFHCPLLDSGVGLQMNWGPTEAEMV